MPKATMPSWFVYIIESDDGSLYTGITTNVERRFQEHQGILRGAKYFNGRKPVAIVYQESEHNRSSASKREMAIKKMTRQQKLALAGLRKSAPKH